MVFMISTSINKLTLLASTLLFCLLILLPVACGPAEGPGEEELDENGQKNRKEKAIDPDTFSLFLKEGPAGKNYVIVKLKPGSSGMDLNDFFVTVASQQYLPMGAIGKHSESDGQGAVKGRFNYALDLRAPQSLGDICLTDPARMGSEDRSFAAKKQIQFRVAYVAIEEITQEEQFTLTVTVECQGDKPHREEQTLELTAEIPPQKNEGKQKKPKNRKENLP